LNSTNTTPHTVTTAIEINSNLQNPSLSCSEMTTPSIAPPTTTTNPTSTGFFEVCLSFDVFF
jgi:hypothetical protein